jgi:hypothetical protein
VAVLIFRADSQKTETKEERDFIYREREKCKNKEKGRHSYVVWVNVPLL